MSEIAISIDNIGKCYERYIRPVDRLKEMFLPVKNRVDEFWALQGVNLAVPRGETLGIVGRNGSGKSTLLQIVAGTLRPTTGQVRVRGRLSALLELGSGFNPDFTGRENVYFNAQVLGLTRKYVDERFDAIAGFADIGDFIDQPVKTYSSGMFVRLAFAVAVSYDPDILIVDEALSVGDAVFQRKCFARIQSIQNQGGTILFVSHSANAVISLCRHAVLLEHGEMLLRDRPKTVLAKYHKLLYAPADQAEQVRQEIRELGRQERAAAETPTSKTGPPTERPPAAPSNADEFYDPRLVPKSQIAFVSRGARVTNPRILTLDGKVVNMLMTGREYVFAYEVEFTAPAFGVRFSMMIKTIRGFHLGGGATHIRDEPIEYVEPGTTAQVKFRFRCLLQPRIYFLNAAVRGIIDGVEVFLDRQYDIAMFRVQPEKGLLATALVDFGIEPEYVLVSAEQAVLGEPGERPVAEPAGEKLG